MSKIGSFLGQKLISFGMNLVGTRAAGPDGIVDLSGSNNIFGTMGAGVPPILSRMGFIPADGSGNVIDLTGNITDGNAKWIGLDSKIMQFWAYVFCSPLATVIDRLAEADTNGIVRFVDEDNIPVKNANKIPRIARLQKLLRRPNPWQTWEEFEGEQVSTSKIFGYCPVFAINPGFEDRTYTTALVNLNPLLVTPVTNYEFDIFGESSYIKTWRFGILGKMYDIPAKDVFLVKDSFVSNTQGNSLNLPMSKINGLDFCVSNICAAMEADNVLLKKKGPLGIFSFDPGKDMAGATPLDPIAKDELQKDLQRYGLTVGQIQYVISKMPIKWNPISFNSKDLTTKETVRQSIDMICDRYGYAAELMSGKNATYENRTSSEKWVYNNGVIPYARRRMQNYNNYFSLEGITMIKDFSELPALQEDIVKAGEAEFYESQSLLIDWMAGALTWNQWQVAKGRDSVAGMDIYYPDYLKKFPDLNPNKSNAQSTPPKDPGTKK